jgi:hypothetical protein
MGMRLQGSNGRVETNEYVHCSIQFKLNLLLKFKLLTSHPSSGSGIYYRSLYNYSLTPTSFIADLKHDTTLSFLKSYFQLDVSLKPLYGSWSTDRVFAMKLKEAGGRLDGMRVLKQDPFETLIS